VPPRGDVSSAVNLRERTASREKTIASANFSPRGHSRRWPRRANPHGLSAKSPSAADGIRRASYRDRRRRVGRFAESRPKGL